MEEIWKDIKGYEGLYQVSNFGRVKSFIRGKESILKNYISDRGYCKSVLRTKEKNSRKEFKTHRLVAITFIPNPMNKPDVNHINGDKLNNNIYNLEWCTKSENITHSCLLGLHNIKNITVLDTHTGVYYNSVLEASKFNAESRHLIRKSKRFLCV